MRKKVLDTAVSLDKTRKSPRLNKFGRTRRQIGNPSESRGTGAKNVQPARAIRSMKFAKINESDTGDYPLPGNGKRGSLRTQNARKAAEKASEDIAMELIFEDETDEETKLSSRDGATGNDDFGVFDSTDETESKSGNGTVAPKKGRRPKRRRGPKRRLPRPDHSEQGDASDQSDQDDGQKAPAEAKSDGESESTPNLPASKKAKVKTGMLEKLQDSSGFVDRVEISTKPEDIVPMRRTPRMASLNALAKVNAVLDSYGPAATKTSSEVKKTREKKFAPYGGARAERHERKSLSSLTFNEHHGASKAKRRRCSSLSSQMEHRTSSKNGTHASHWSEHTAGSHPYFFESEQFYNEELFTHASGYVSSDEQPISDNHVSSTSNWAAIESGIITKKDKAVQTMVNHKAVQTDAYLLQGYRMVVDSNQRTCRCGKSKVSSYGRSGATKKAFTRIPPRINPPAVDVPLKSSLFAKTDLHTISIPFTKRHILSHTDLRDVDELSSHNLDISNHKRIANLNAVAMMNAMVVLDQPYSSLLNNSYLYRHSHRVPLIEKQQGTPLKIPKINYAATSTSNFSSSNKNKGHLSVNYKGFPSKGFPNTVERLLGKRAPPTSPKMVNGWMFDGEPIEKPFEYDDRIVLRRYYTSMRRNNEVINVRDSVLLKSGTKKRDIPFVARVAAIWEEESDDSVSDMTISVFWYYRPEQTEIGRVGNFHGEMEVLASRHRDDNSVACIVDKCYVLSYPQYCRFRARSKLYRESRKTPLSPVPPAESTRPGSMPPPNTDPSLVFFCRQVYDFRTGRVLKTPFY